MGFLKSLLVYATLATCLGSFTGVLGQDLATTTSKPTAKPTALTLKVTTNAKGGVRNKTAPLLHGLFFEDINVCIFF